MKKVVQSVGTVQIVLVAWLIFSGAYIVHDLWKNGLSATYQSGYQKAFADVIGQSQQCEPFNVFVGEAKVDLINMACLQQAPQGGAASAEAPTEGTEPSVLEEEAGA